MKEMSYWISSVVVPGLLHVPAPTKNKRRITSTVERRKVSQVWLQHETVQSWLNNYWLCIQGRSQGGSGGSIEPPFRSISICDIIYARLTAIDTMYMPVLPLFANS